MIPYSFINNKVPFPLTLSNLCAWLDFSNFASITMNLATLRTCADLSGNNNTMTITPGSAYPGYAFAVQNGLNAMQVYNTAQVVWGVFANNFPPVSSSAFSLCFLLKTPATLGQPDYIFHGTNVGSLYILTNFTVAGIGVIASSPLSTSTWYRIVYVFNLGAGTNQVQCLYINAVSTGGDLGDLTTAIAPGTMGIGYNTATVLWEGYWGEVILRNAVMTPTDITNLDNYWRAKWNL